VPINNKTVYLNLRRFNTIQLDEDAGTVKLGGGAVTRDVIHALSK